MSCEERMMRYCKIDTQSNPENAMETPSTKKQFDLAKVLVKELEEFGLENVTLDEHCYVYGWLPSNIEQPCKTVGFIAHMDTAPDFNGTNVNPRIIECFDGKDIVLNDEVVTKMEDFPDMKKLVGKRLMVTDGNTLLGADDKAGICAIMEALAYFVSHPEVKHGRIAVGFTPDEEIGNGAKYFDIEKFGADFAYTMDGGAIDVYSEETFNAASAVVSFKGFSIHPGSAKDKMIDAASVACHYHSLLPQQMTPEHTEGREGFIHLGNMKGDTESATLEYIIRDHDANKLEEKKQLLQNAVAYINTLYGEGTATITLRNAYRNMIEVLSNHPEVKDTAFKAMADLGIVPLTEAIRGGTDGAELSYRGLPCPNLGTGGGNCHGRYEYCDIAQMEQASQLIIAISKRAMEA